MWPPSKQISILATSEVCQEVSAHQITLYSPLTNAFASLLVPSHTFARAKLSGLGSTFTRPASAAKPENTINARMTSLKTPRAFCSRIPHFKKHECMMKANVTQPIPMARWFHCVTSLPAARRISEEDESYEGGSQYRIRETGNGEREFCLHSPKTTEFPAGHGMSAAYAA